LLTDFAISVSRHLREVTTRLSTSAMKASFEKSQERGSKTIAIPWCDEDFYLCAKVLNIALQESFLQVCSGALLLTLLFFFDVPGAFSYSSVIHGASAAQDQGRGQSKRQSYLETSPCGRAIYILCCREMAPQIEESGQF
jgi:hypothetical protein